VKKTAVPRLLAWVRFQLQAPHLPPKAVLLPRVVVRLPLLPVLLAKRVWKVLLLLAIPVWKVLLLLAIPVWKDSPEPRVQLTPPL
jgi:hypothetical protein